jgi:hypothetical protein
MYTKRKIWCCVYYCPIKTDLRKQVQCASQLTSALERDWRLTKRRRNSLPLERTPVPLDPIKNRITYR